jgi:hypothetical protein
LSQELGLALRFLTDDFGMVGPGEIGPALGRGDMPSHRGKIQECLDRIARLVHELGVGFPESVISGC